MPHGKIISPRGPPHLTPQKTCFLGVTHDLKNEPFQSESDNETNDVNDMFKNRAWLVFLSLFFLPVTVCVAQPNGSLPLKEEEEEKTEERPALVAPNIVASALPEASPTVLQSDVTPSL